MSVSLCFINSKSTPLHLFVTTSIDLLIFNSYLDVSVISSISSLKLNSLRSQIVFTNNLSSTVNYCLTTARTLAQCLPSSTSIDLSLSSLKSGKNVAHFLISSLIPINVFDFLSTPFISNNYFLNVLTSSSIYAGSKVTYCNLRYPSNTSLHFLIWSHNFLTTLNSFTINSRFFLDPIVSSLNPNVSANS